MDYDISIAETGSYIIITYFVPMTTALACRSGPELVRLSAENNINHFLFDMREAKNVQSVTNNYIFANQDIQTFDFPRASVSAFLVSEGDESHDFITTAFLNAGYLVKLFTDKKAAVAWLEGCE